jgi:hypothetical protein
VSFPFDIHSAAVSDSHLPCHAPTMPFFRRETAVLCCGVEKNGMVGAWHGECESPHCVNQMGKTHSKPLAARHGWGNAWARHGNGMLCVNRALVYARKLSALQEIGLHVEGASCNIVDNWQLCETV